MTGKSLGVGKQCGLWGVFLQHDRDNGKPMHITMPTMFLRDMFWDIYELNGKLLVDPEILGERFRARDDVFSQERFRTPESSKSQGSCTLQKQLRWYILEPLKRFGRTTSPGATPRFFCLGRPLQNGNSIFQRLIFKGYVKFFFFWGGGGGGVYVFCFLGPDFLIPGRVMCFFLIPSINCPQSVQTELCVIFFLTKTSWWPSGDE